jgi:uracil-DNA glycosylase
MVRERAVVPPMPVGGVMLLGHDFHSVAGYEWSRKNITENLESPTWRNLLAMLRAVPVALESCFFTNAYMGSAREHGQPGRSPAPAMRRMWRAVVVS